MTAEIKQPARNSPAVHELQPPLFVLSVWRSGSSLLYSLLNQHSQIALLYEGDLPRLHRFLRGRFRNGTWRERWEFWNQGPSRHEIAIDSLPSDVGNAWDATRMVYQQVARRKDAIIWGEKTPHWYDCALQMAEHFPDARFIFLWRDMNDVIESISRAALGDRFFRKAGMMQRALIGIENLKKSCDTLKTRGRQVHEVNYEELTSKTSDCMRQICTFLDVPFEARMSTLEGANRSAINSGQHHAQVRSSRINRPKSREHFLSAATQNKIARYNCRWKSTYDGNWPRYPAELPADTKPPTFFELSCDRGLYYIGLCRDKMVALIYALTPISVARALRGQIRHRTVKAKLLPTTLQ